MAPKPDKKLRPKEIAGNILAQKVDVMRFQTFLDDVPSLYEAEAVIPMEQFIGKVLPRVMDKHQRFEQLSEVMDKEIKTGFDHNAEEQLESLLRHDAPYIDLVAALKKVASSKKLNDDDRKALKAGPAVIGAVLADRQAAVEALRAHETSPAGIEEYARAQRVARLVHEEITGQGSTLPSERPIVGDDYRRAKAFTDGLREDISQLDSSPEMLGKLQGQLMALNNAMGRGDKPLA